jgi:outer membrane receptor protein involved in Fe transport
MKNFLVALFILFSISAFSQNNDPDRQAPAIGVLSGKVVDEIGKPMEFVSVALESLRNGQIVSGGITDVKGNFLIEKIPVGGYKVKVAFMGFESAVIDSVILSPRTSVERDLGTIILKSNSNELKEVAVVEQSNFYTQGIDKKAYSVSELPLTKGATLGDIINNIPSLEVDQDGNISLRGSGNITILVDGKPSLMTSGDPQAFLNQFPAEAIERIEIITNPGAKYDPEGMGGIINIITKKNSFEGFSGNASVNVGTRDKYTGNVVLNYKKDKWNLSGSYSWNYRDMFFVGNTNRTNFLSEGILRLDQNTDGERIHQSHMMRFASDYYLSKKSTISFGITQNIRPNMQSENLDYVFFDGFNSLLNNQERGGGEAGNNYGTDINLGYLFEKGKDHSLSIDVRYSANDGSSEGHYSNTYFDQFEQEVDTLYWAQRTNSLSDMDLLIGQVDYTRPVGKNQTLEAGGRYAGRFNDRALNSDRYSYEQPFWQVDTNQTNQFLYNENVFAAYGTYAISWEKLGIKGGLRAEQTFIETELVQTGQQNPQNYLNFFPSLHTTYSLNTTNQLKLSYSKRISRPREQQLNPFTDVADAQNIRTGNPNLTPEYTHSTEMEYTRFFKKGMASAAVYYRYTEDNIGRVKVVDTNGVAYNTFANLSYAQSFGLELIVNLRPTSWWTLTMSTNMYQSMVDGSNVSGSFVNSGMSMNGRIMSNMKAKNGISGQLTFQGNAPRPTAQGTFKGAWGLDAGVQKDIMNGKGTVSLRLTDAFYTRRMAWESAGERFEENAIRQFDSRNIYVGFSYRFGEYNMKKDRKGGGGNDGGGGEMDDMM